MPRRYAILSLLAWLLAGVAISTLSGGAMQAGLRGGWLTGGLAGATTLVALSWSLERALPAVLQAAAVGFLLRLSLLAGGVFLSLRGGASAVGFGVAFFGIFLLCQGLEVVVLHGRPRAEARP